MSMTQTTTEITPSGDPHCPHCGVQLPLQATFCASCGERVIKKQTTSLLQDNQDIASSYRITSLIRRRPFIRLFLATDIRQQRPVALRDIDISSLDNEGRNRAATAVQQEYDLLRRQHIPSVIPLIDVRHFQNHLYVIAGWPRNSDNSTSIHTFGSHLHTLQDVLQSGQGLPQENLALTWIDHLCQSLYAIHNSGIVIADLDPQTIILHGNTYASELALMVSWLPPALQSLFPRISTIANTTNYTAPEVLLGKPEPRSDIYSLGALLYLLLTGTPPEEPLVRTQRRLRLPGELNSRVSTALDDFIMKALAIDAADRFSNALEMHDALIHIRTGIKRIHTAKDNPPKMKTNNTITTAAPNSTTDSSSSVLLSTPTEETLIAGPCTDDPADDTGIPGAIVTIEAAISTNNTDDPATYEQHIEEIVSTDTVLISPLPANNQHGWQSLPVLPPATPLSIEPVDAAIDVTPQHANIDIEHDEDDEFDMPGFVSPPVHPNASIASRQDSSIGQRFKRHITGLLPAVPRSAATKTTGNAAAPQNASASTQAPSSPVTIPGRTTVQPKSTTNSTTGAPTFFQQLQRMFLGEQKQASTAAAIIETPLRVQPNQHYQIRIHVMGRSRPVIAPDSKNGAIAGGLSSLVEGDLVSIEVRSALYQNYAYVVQQATVQVPESGYAAEVTIPMHPLSHGPSGRRDRLHIFFMDERRRSLYEKPFVVELFISHLVQPGREGHNVLTIPL